MDVKGGFEKIDDFWINEIKIDDEYTDTDEVTPVDLSFYDLESILKIIKNHDNEIIISVGVEAIESNMRENRYQLVKKDGVEVFEKIPDKLNYETPEINVHEINDAELGFTFNCCLMENKLGE